MHFQTALKHIRRSPYQAVSAVMIMTFTFFIAAVFLLLAAGSYLILNFFESKPQITAFFKDKTEVKEIQKLKNKIEKLPQTAKVKYISKEEALAIYKDQNKNDPLLLEMVTAEILPASLEISANNLSDLKILYQEIKKDKNIEEIIYQKDIIENLSRWTKGLRIIGISILSFLVIDSILIILTIIGMKIALRKEEIEILQLLGASPGYIEGPFLIEGIIYGLLGAILGWGITVLLIWQADPLLSSFLSSTPLYPIPSLVFFLLLIILLSGGFFIGYLGSRLAVKRYLK